MMNFRRAERMDIEAVALFYDQLMDHMIATNTNYPRWMKGFYPNEETAQDGILQEELYLLEEQGEILGSIVLNQDQPSVFETEPWGVAATPSQVLMIHTFCVGPKGLHRGCGKKLLEHTKALALEQGKKTIRLDVLVENLPAIGLYESAGYQRVGLVDLGLEIEGLKWFYTYELIL